MIIQISFQHYLKVCVHRRRDIMFAKYVDQTDGDIQEALALMAWRMEQAQRQESYEECAIIKDILDEFEYLSR